MKEKIMNPRSYPFSVPAIKEMDTLELDKEVTFFVGENGSGKSTLLEAIAYQCGFNTDKKERYFEYLFQEVEDDD